MRGRGNPLPLAVSGDPGGFRFRPPLRGSAGVFVRGKIFTDRTRRRALAILEVAALLGAMVGCSAGEEQRGEEMRPEKPIEEVVRDQTDSLLTIPGVEGTAVGECEGAPCIKVYVREKTDELMARIPARLDGYPVSVRETGEFRALEPE